MNDSKHILLCLAGLTPQIITETLYAITQQRRERVDEIRIITTLAGRDRVLQALLASGTGQFFAFCRDYGIRPESIRFDETCVALLHQPNGLTLADIRAKEEYDYAADRICEIVRELAKDDNARIHASAAGGRKTMGIFLANAMQLFGRRQDVLSHVLVNEPFENHPDFYYPPPQAVVLDVKDRQGTLLKRVSTAEARIELAEIPFVRLRGVLKDWLATLPNSYGEIVERTQIELDLQDAAQDLRLECKSKSLHLLHQKVGLTEREFFFYLLFARARKLGRGKDGFLGLKEITYEELDATFRLLSRARGEECGVGRASEFPRFDFMPGLLRDLQLSDETSLQTTLIEVVARIKAKLAKHHFPERCWITAKDARVQLRYGLAIAPERISWD